MREEETKWSEKSRLEKFYDIGIRLFPIALFAWATTIEILDGDIDNLFPFLIINVCFAANAMFAPIMLTVVTVIFWSGVMLTESGITPKDIFSWTISLVMIGFMLCVFTPLGDWIKKKLNNKNK